MLNIETLKLDNNQIDDISVFSDVSFEKIRNLSIQKNPIKKGLHALKNGFFKKSVNIDISVSKLKNEYKIYTEFINPKLIIEFFISDIEDIKNIFDFETCVIYLKTIYVEENKEGLNEVQKLYDKVKSLIDVMQNHDKINKNNDNSISIDSNENDKEPFDNKSSNSEDDCDNNKVYNNHYSDSEDNYDYKKISNFSNNYLNYNELGDYCLPHIIIDNGSGYCKAGLSEEEGPRAVFPSYIGYPKYPRCFGSMDKRDFFIGADAEASRGVLKLYYPIENGYIKNWDVMEKIWEYIFTKELRVDPVEHNLVITENSSLKEKNREKIAQVMFETFCVHGLYIANPSSLALYSSGKFTGIVVDSGEGDTKIVPMLDGYSIYYANSTVEVGGKTLTEYLMPLIYGTSHIFTTTVDKEIVKAIKEKACYISLDYMNELKYVEPYSYELPDGNHALIKYPRIECPEALFTPSIVYKNGIGIAQALYNSIQRSDFDIRKDLYNSIILSGGTTMFSGFEERLTKEIVKLAPESMKKEVNVIAPLERKFSSWNGGSILSSISTFEAQWISKTEYEECGSNIVHRKCF